MGFSTVTQISLILYILFLQVEIELFPDMKDKKLFLRSVHVEEALVQDHMNEAVDVFKLNTVGPQKQLLLHLTFSLLDQIIYGKIICRFFNYFASSSVAVSP